MIDTQALFPYKTLFIVPMRQYRSWAPGALDGGSHQLRDSKWTKIFIAVSTQEMTEIFTVKNAAEKISIVLTIT